MSIYCEKCRTRIAVGNTCSTCGHLNPGGGVASEKSAGQPSYSGNQPSYTTTPTYSQSQTFSPPSPAGQLGSFKKSLGGSVTLIVFSALGVLSPFLSYVSFDDYGESVNGWDSQEFFSDYERFSNTPLLVLLGSLLLLGLGIAVVTNQNQGKPTNKTAAGVTTLVTGVVVALSAGNAYSSWDWILRYEGEVGSQGVGLWFGALSGVAAVVIGIVMLAVPKVTQGS